MAVYFSMTIYAILLVASLIYTATTSTVEVKKGCLTCMHDSRREIQKVDHSNIGTQVCLKVNTKNIRGNCLMYCLIYKIYCIQCNHIIGSMILVRFLHHDFDAKLLIQLWPIPSPINIDTKILMIIRHKRVLRTDVLAVQTTKGK